MAGSAAALALQAPAPATQAPPSRLWPPPKAVTVEMALDRPAARFSPMAAIGGALDGHESGETARVYAPASVRAMAGAGLGEVAYRLRTELGVQAWHFDPAGSWSEPARRAGYWTGASRPSSATLEASWGYALPRRGDTVDQADDNGYSRLDDGDLSTYWKSDPYLDARFTHEPEAEHPQWVLVDLGASRPVNALRIAWGAPYALRLRAQRYVGGPDAVALAPGRWVDFPIGAVRGHPGVQTLRLARAPLSTRFVRVLMTRSSHTAPAGSHDVRDRLGFAIRELYVGRLDGGRRFHDLLTHAPDRAQSRLYTSSTDPWHRAVDLNRGYEQPSFQTVMRSGLTRGRPLLVPVPVLYGTPANAVAELRYLRALGVPLRGVELGEEPDGQLVSPEDYGALYVQFARAIHRAFPKLALGGPGFATSLPDWAYWPDARGDRSWTHRFIRYLRMRHALGLLGFFSFEWYPFDDVCAPPGPQLARSAQMLGRLLALQRREGLPGRLPVYVTEYGYSAYAGQDEVDMPAALLDAETVATLLASGGTAAYLYGYEPSVPIREARRCDTWGDLMLLLDRGAGRAPAPLAAFWETRMLTRDWTMPGDRAHALFVGRSSAVDGSGDQLVRAYAVRRPDGRLSLLLLNLSPSQPYRARVRLRHRGRTVGMRGRAQEWQLSSGDYRWSPFGPAGHPSIDDPPAHATLVRAPRTLDLPPYSITVLTARSG